VSLPPLPDDAITLLRRPNAAVISTLRADGSPVTTVTWYLWEDDDRVLINMDESRVRLKHLRRDPKVSLTVLAEGDLYTHLTVIGRVVDLSEDTDLSGIDRLSRQYTGKQYAQRDRLRYNAWIEVDRWHGWGRFQDTDQPNGRP
jgi:PPOX class probable F420-dependent enzyme